MTAKIWIARAIWYLGLLAVANVVLADATLRPGDQIENEARGCAGDRYFFGKWYLHD